MSSACETAQACKPVRALQGGMGFSDVGPEIFANAVGTHPHPNLPLEGEGAFRGAANARCTYAYSHANAVPLLIESPHAHFCINPSS